MLTAWIYHIITGGLCKSEGGDVMSEGCGHFPFGSAGRVEGGLERKSVQRRFLFQVPGDLMSAHDEVGHCGEMDLFSGQEISFIKSNTVLNKTGERNSVGHIGLRGKRTSI